ncbi:Uncharacterized protein HZ326_16346 [Fusarium oxysporum f. sp. albedinis]|nr:Uncharacterized protein HZ326_16346 [Fusarium oxysporum f. sp. albedinis]
MVFALDSTTVPQFYDGLFTCEGCMSMMDISDHQIGARVEDHLGSRKVVAMGLRGLQVSMFKSIVYHWDIR